MTDLTDEQREALRKLGSIELFSDRLAGETVTIGADPRGHALDLEWNNTDPCASPDARHSLCELDPAKARALVHYLTEWLEIVENGND